MREDVRIVDTYGHSGHLGEPVITVRDDDHTPYNKRPGSCKSFVTLEVLTHRRGEWTTFKLEEITTNENWDTGKKTTQTRTITMTLPKAIADEVAKVVSGQHSKAAKQPRKPLKLVR